MAGLGETEPFDLGAQVEEQRQSRQMTQSTLPTPRWVKIVVGIAILALTAAVLGVLLRTERAVKRLDSALQQPLTCIVNSGGVGDASGSSGDGCDGDTLRNVEFISGSVYNWVNQTILPTLQDIITTLTDLFTTAGDLRNMLLATLNEVIATEECHPVLVIPDGGLVIAEPGCWRLTKPFNYTEGNPFISVLSNDVTVDLGGFMHTLSGTQIGVMASNVNNTVVRFGGMRTQCAYSNSTNSRGIIAYGTHSVGLHVHGVKLEGQLRGIDVIDISDVLIEDCTFARHKGFDGVSAAMVDRAAPITFSGASNIRLRSVSIRDSIIIKTQITQYLSSWRIGTRISASTGRNVSNLKINDVQIYNGASISLFSARSVEINNVQHYINDSTYASNFVELSLGCVSVGIRDSLFVNEIDTHPGFDGIVVTGRQIAIDRVRIKQYASARTVEGPLNTASIHVGQALTNALFLSNDGVLSPSRTYNAEAVTISHCHILGAMSFDDSDDHATTAGIYVEPNNRGVVITNNVIAGFRIGEAGSGTRGDQLELRTAGVLVHGSSGVVIRDNSISDGGANSTTPTYGGDGIFLAGQFNITTAVGVTVVPATSNCIVEHNTLHSNGGYGVRDDGNTNWLVHNMAHNNALGRYGGSGIGSAIISNLGDATLESSNL